MFDCKDTDRLQTLACFSGQMKLTGRAKLSQQKRDVEADQVTYVRGPMCLLPPTARLTGEVLWLLGQESRWAPVNTALQNTLPLIFYLPAQAQFLLLPPFSLMPGRRLEGFSCENNPRASFGCAHSVSSAVGVGRATGL